MITYKTIDQVTELLQISDLSWLLPNLRQDYVVWNSLLEPEFFNKFVQLKQVEAGYLPSDFAPSRLALIALDQTDGIMNGSKDFLESINDHVQQMAIRSLNDQAFLLSTPQNLVSAGLIALALAYKYRASNSWNGLLELILEIPGNHWHSPLACLFGFVDGSVGLLNSLVQPGASTIRIELAVHVVLSNPILPNEQIAILMGLCHGAYDDLLPARERMILINALCEQRPQTAVDFCIKWLEIHPNQSNSPNQYRYNSIEEINLLAENLFQVEVNRIIGNDEYIPALLANEKEITQNVALGLATHYASKISKHQSEKLSTHELSTIKDQFTQPSYSKNNLGKFSTEKSQMALVLADQGLLDDANELIPPPNAPLPDEPDILYSIAVIADKTGNYQRAEEAATKLIAILEQKASCYSLPVWGDFISQVNLGKLMLHLNKPEDASRIFLKAVQTCPNDASLLKNLAESYKYSQNFQQEAAIMRTLISLGPGNLDYHRALAQSLENTGDWEEGLIQRSFIVETSRVQSKILPIDDIYAYIKSSYKAHRPDLTLTLCSDLLSKNQEDWQALIYSGKAYIEINEIDKGLDFLTKATHVSPDVADAWLALAEAQKKIYPTKTVIDTLNNASQVVPDAPQIHFMLGELYLHDDALSLALPELQFAMELSPEDPQILVRYGQVLNLLGHLEQSHTTLAKAYHLDPTIPGLAQQYSKILIDMGLLEQAIPPLETLINTKNSQDVAPKLDYARCILSLHQQGSPKYPPMKALIALNEVLQIDPDNAEAKALIAETLTANGDMEMAFHAYREALDTSLVEDKDWLERLSFGFGCVASTLGKHDIAIAALQEAVQVNPDNQAVQKVLSDAYLAAGLPEDAIRAARNVLVINGEDPDNLAWFAKQSVKFISHSKSGTLNSSSSISKTIPNEALNALAKAIHLAPTRTDLIVQLGSFQSYIGALEDSKRTFSSIALLDFSTIDDLKRASEYLSGLGDHDAAIACLENGITQDLIAADKHDPLLYSMLAKEYVTNNDHTSAINTLDKAMDILPDDSSLVSYKIDILLGLGQPIEALNCIESAIQKSSNGEQNIDFLFLASRINHAIGDFSAAIKYIQTSLDIYSRKDVAVALPQIPIQYRNHIAEIYRALIQPDQAFKIINDENELITSNFPDEQSYLDFICLHTELALETGNQIRSGFQDIQPEISSPSFSRYMAINARLLNKAGNYQQAEKLFQIAIKSLANLDQLSHLPNWSVSYIKYLTINSIVDAALDLGFWDQCLRFAQGILESSPGEPLSSLNIAKTIVLRAEYYNLCQKMDASAHKPSDNSISEETFILFSRYIENSKSALMPYKSDAILVDYNLAEDQIYRWKSRAQIAFNNFEDSTTDPGDILNHQHTPGDSAALISHFHRLDLQDPDSDSITRIIKIARTNTRNPIILLQVALAIQDNNPVDAMKSLQSVLEQNPYSKTPSIAFCNVLLAKIALSHEELEVAQVAIENAINIWPDEPEWHALAAQIYNRITNTHEAINHLVEATRLAPKTFSHHMELGKIYFENSNEDPHLLRLALTSFENAIGLEPNEISTLILLAKTQHLLNDLENAQISAQKALMLAPNRADIYQLLSEISICNNDFQGGYEYANKAIQLNPKDLRSNIMLVRSLSSLGRNDEALVKINTVLPMVQEAKYLQLERVNIIRNMNGPRAGLTELKKMLDSDPEDFNILNALAKTYIEVGEADNAVNVAQQALKVCKENSARNDQANLHLLIGQVLRKIGQLDQSIHHLGQAIQLAPDRLEPYLELGLARKERREYDQALQIFEQATSIAPEDPRAPFQAGLALKESKDYKSSETMLRRAVSLAPHDLNIRRQLAAVVALNLVHNPKAGRI